MSCTVNRRFGCNVSITYDCDIYQDKNLQFLYTTVVIVDSDVKTSHTLYKSYRHNVKFIIVNIKRFVLLSRQHFLPRWYILQPVEISLILQRI